MLLDAPRNEKSWQTILAGPKISLMVTKQSLDESEREQAYVKELNRALGHTIGAVVFGFVFCLLGLKVMALSLPTNGWFSHPFLPQLAGIGVAIILVTLIFCIGWMWLVLRKTKR